MPTAIRAASRPDLQITMCGATCCVVRLSLDRNMNRARIQSKVNLPQI